MPSFSFRSVVACGSVGLVAALGCVSASEHRQVVGELDHLRQRSAAQADRIERLEAEETYLGDELAQNLEAFEDLSIEYQALAEDAAQLRSSEASLEVKLRGESERLVLSMNNLAQARSEVDRLTSTYTTLMEDLESEVSSGQIEIEQLREGIRVSVSDDIIFASGSAELDPVGRKVLEKVSSQLVKLDHSIEVQGHTDDQGLKASLRERFPTNWELAAARAARVTRLMQERGIPGERLRVVSFASYRPMVSNDSADNRSQNRRIEIRLKPRPREPISSLPDSATPPTGQ